MIDGKVLAIIREQGAGCGGVDEWEIASSIYPWDAPGCRSKHGAWINQVIRAGERLQAKDLVGCYAISHGLPGYDAPQSRIWFAKVIKGE